MRQVHSSISKAGGAAVCALVLLSASPAAQVVYVDGAADGAADGTSWDDAFPDLVDGFAAAAEIYEAEVWIAGGVYRPDGGTGERERSFALPAGARIFGGFVGDETLRESRDADASPTILSGDLRGDDGSPGGSTSDNSHHVVLVDEPFGLQSFLDGVTIVGGDARGAAEPDGGGALVRGGSVTFTDVTFERNVARDGGGAYVTTDGSPGFYYCTFLGNTASGDGGAVAVVEPAFPTVVGSRFHGNTAQGRGGALASAGIGGFGVLNSIFTGNTALTGDGGAIAFSDGFPVVNGSTIVDNFAGGGADALSFGAALLQLKGTILWGPEGGVEMLGNTAGPAEVWVDTNDIKGLASLSLPPGSNVDVEPSFVDVDGADDVLGTLDDDVRLRPNSPLVDAGPSAAGTGLDVNRRSRLLDGLLDGNNRSDVGAHEATNLTLRGRSRVAPGGTLTVEVRAAPGLGVVLMASPADGFLIDSDLGALLVDLPSLSLFAPLGAASSVSFELPATIAPDVVYFQAFGTLPGSSIGNGSNLLEIAID